MRKFAIIAFAFVLSATMMAGCRGGSDTDMTTMPTNNTTQTNSTVPSETGARRRIGGDRDNRMPDGNIVGRIDRQHN